MEVSSSDEELIHRSTSSLTAAPHTKTEDLQMLILDNNTRMDLDMDIRSVQVHLVVAHQRKYYNNSRVHLPTQSALIRG